MNEDENIKFEPKNFSWKEENLNDDYKYYKNSRFNKYNKYNYKNKRHFKGNKFNKKNKITFIEKEIEFAVIVTRTSLNHQIKISTQILALTAKKIRRRFQVWNSPI